MSIVATPTVPVIAAGAVATAAEMNALGAAALFVMNRPTTYIASATLTYTATLTYYNPSWATPVLDTDGMYSAGSPTILTVQRYGFYDVQVNLETSMTTTTNLIVGIFCKAGANNPTASSGSFLFGSAANWFNVQMNSSGNALGVSGGGIIPGALYPGDIIEAETYIGSGGAGKTLTAAKIRVRWIGAA